MDNTKDWYGVLKAVMTKIIANTSASNQIAPREQPTTDRDAGRKDSDDTQVSEEDINITWVTARDITVTQDDKRMILGGEKLMDQHISSAQR